MNSDFHVHTEFSSDSQASMDQYIRQAIDNGIKKICFTDHVDLNKRDFGYNYYRSNKFFEKFNELKNQNRDEVQIYAGIEFGEPHLYADELKRLSVYPYDYIIGSIHWVGDLFPCHKVREQYLAKEFYTLYWKEMLSTVKQGGFDVLGHIDFPKRYYGEIYHTEEIMKEIFKYLLEKDMVLEINTSSVRKGCADPMPGEELLEIYKECGGLYVTVGSDAHEIKDLGSDRHVAEKMIQKLSLQEVIYEKRKRQICFGGELRGKIL